MSRLLTVSNMERSFSSSPKHTTPPGSMLGNNAASALPFPDFGACTSTTFRPRAASSLSPSRQVRSIASICSPLNSVLRKWIAVLAGLTSSHAPGIRSRSLLVWALKRSSASLCALRGMARPLSPISRAPEIGTRFSS